MDTAQQPLGIFEVPGVQDATLAVGQQQYAVRSGLVVLPVALGEANQWRRRRRLEKVAREQGVAAREPAQGAIAPPATPTPEEPASSAPPPAAGAQAPGGKKAGKGK